MTPLRIRPASFGFTVLLGLFAALPALSIDISAPTLVLLPAALGTSAIVAGLTLSLFMVGFACGQLGGGIVSDRIGRRRVLLIGLACFTVAGAACAFSPTAAVLVVARLIQGTGAGACSVQAFAMVQDLFEGDAARGKRSYVTVVFGAVPMFAPALGAVLSGLAGWRSVHTVLALAGAVLLLVTWAGVAESLAARRAPSAHAMPTDTGPIWRDATFLGYAAANALSYGGVFSYVAGSPIVMMRDMGLPSGVYAALFAATSGALTLGAFTGARLGRRGFGANALLGPALACSTLAGFALCAASLAGATSGAILVPALLVALFCRGIIAPNMQHQAIERRRARAGTASAVVGVSQLLSGALGSAVVAALLSRLGATAVALPMSVFATLALIAWWWTVSHARRGGRSKQAGSGAALAEEAAR